MDKVIKSKRNLELVTSCSLGYQTIQKHSFISYVLSEQVWWCNTKWLLSYSKKLSANLCKPIHDIINYSTSTCPFESGNCGQKGKKIQKFEYLENENCFFDEIKNFFYSFWRAIIWWKKWNWKEIAGASFNGISRKRWEICSKLITKTPVFRQGLNISAIVFLLLTMNK